MKLKKSKLTESRGFHGNVHFLDKWTISQNLSLRLNLKLGWSLLFLLIGCQCYVYMSLPCRSVGKSVRFSGCRSTMFVCPSVLLFILFIRTDIVTEISRERLKHSRYKHNGHYYWPLMMT